MGPISPDDLRFNRFGLSQQESRVLALAMSGRIDKQIASEMGISLGTVRVYWKRIRQKVGGTRSEVIAELARTSLKLDFDGKQKQADELAKELEESAERERDLRVYESVFEIVPTPLAILDAPDGRLVKVNAAFAELHGYSIEELLDKPAKSLMESKDATRFVSQAKKAALDGKHFEGPFKRVRKDGTTFETQLAVAGDEESNWVVAVRS